METQGSWTRIMSIFCAQQSCRNVVWAAEVFLTLLCAMRRDFAWALRVGRLLIVHIFVLVEVLVLI